jgi:hypothetical protein
MQGFAAACRVIFILCALAAVGCSRDGSNAALALRRISDASNDGAYYVRFVANGTDVDVFSYYQVPGTGFRLDLAEPIGLEGEYFTPPEGILVGGDILIVSSNAEHPYLSCNTEGRYCRTADGLEVLAIAVLPGLFRYDLSLYPYANEHIVKAVEDATVAGERGKCFLVEGTQQTGEPATATLCYAEDGVPLRVTDDTGATYAAAEVRRDVSEAELEPPFDFVPSVYDE